MPGLQKPNFYAYHKGLSGSVFSPPPTFLFLFYFFCLETCPLSSSPFICQDLARYYLYYRKTSLTREMEKNLGMEENEIRYLFLWHLPCMVTLAMTLSCLSLHLPRWSSPYNSFLPDSCSQCPPLLFWTWVGNSTAASLRFLHSPCESPTSCPHPCTQRIPL